MKAGGRGSAAPHERFSLRRGLVVVQMALSLVLVVGALLFVATLNNLLSLDPGFQPDDILVVDFDLRRAAVPEGRRVAAKRDLVDALSRLPSARSAAQVDMLPLSGSVWNETVLVGGVVQKDYSNFNRVSRRYFETLGTTLVKGRDFDERDTVSSEPVAIVTRTFVRKYLDGRDPLRETFQIEEPPGAERPQYQVIGVVGDTKYRSLREEFTPIAYLAAGQETQPNPYLQVVVRTESAAALIPAIKQTVARVDPRIALDFETLSSQIRRTLQSEALMAALTGSFGVLAGVIAAIGSTA
jgi:putative ABC transport system permease protein